MASSFLSTQLQASGADILPAMASGDGCPPLLRQGSEQRQSVTLSRRDREVHVFEGPLERKLRRKVPTLHLVQLGIRDWRVQRTALNGVG